MITSRLLTDLLPPVGAMCHAFIDSCAGQGIDVLITCTYRDAEAQNALYAQGRTTPGPKVTNAQGGDSFHQWRVAFDFVPIVAGKPRWDDLVTFKRCGALAEAIGLEWAGRWITFREMPHCQFTGGLTIGDFKAGKTLPLPTVPDGG